MNNLYVNPAFPLENSLGTFDENKTKSANFSFDPLDEKKTVNDILQIYFYNNTEKRKKRKD